MRIQFRKIMKRALSWLQDHHKELPEEFDFPTYGGLPSSIAKELTTDEVDHIQDVWEDIKNGTCSY